MDFRFAIGHQTGYETLFYDVLTGDQTLSQRADQNEGGWRAAQPILDARSKDGAQGPYPAGGNGPDSAESLLTRDNRQWHKLG